MSTDDTTGEESPDERELLALENERLRAEYARTQRLKYRRSAFGLAGVGALAALAAVLFPSVRDVLFALAAIGGFAAVLTYYLTPERVVPASVGERVYAAWAENAARITSELGLAETRLYVPYEQGVALFVPRTDDDVPRESLDHVFHAGENGPQGVSLTPTGESLFEEFEATLTGGLASEPGPLAAQIAEGVTETFELADGAQTNTEPGAATLAVDGSVYGDATRFDHPVGSIFAVGLARGLDETVALDVEATPDGRAEYVIRGTWEPSETQ